MRSKFLTVAFCVAATPVAAADLTGNWSGHWSDTKSGHTGPLRAVFRPCDEDHYRVTFSGRFFKVFPFRYTVILSVADREADRIFLTGEQNLGPLFGTFTYTSEADADRFAAHFCSRRYQGDFFLRRCCP
jgi:hypothetical protein